MALLALAGAIAVVLWVSAAGAAQNGSGGPLAQSADVTTRHIPLSKAVGAMPRSLKGVPAKGNYAFLLKLGVESTGQAYESSLPLGKSAARAAATKQLATVHAADSRVTAALPSGSHVLYQMHAIMAGVGVYTNVANLPALQRISGVKAVYPIAPKKPSLSYSVLLQKAPQVWAGEAGIPSDLGENSTVAIIDTGLDYTHADFGGSGNPADYQTALANDTTAPAGGSFDPNKFAGGFDFAGDAYDAGDPAHATPAPDPNPLDCNSHGTHVAGIIGGYGVDTSGNQFGSVAGDYTSLPIDVSSYQALFRIGPGMAPLAKLYSYKVFGCNGSTNVVGAALDRAADPNNDGNTSDHVDVVNMSLGADFASPQDGDSVASDAASALGISVVVASGNAGDLYDVGGSPGNARRVISAAASVDAYSQLDTLNATVNGVPTSYGAQRSVAFDWTGGDFSGQDVVKLTDTSNLDGCDPISQDLTGKVVFLEWTDDDTVRRCGSAARSANAEAAGATGVILGDDVETFSAGITGSADIPVVQVFKSEADEIRTALDASQTVTADSTSANDLPQLVGANDDKVASFSSRGIREAGDVKPDVTGVGVSVFSAGMGTGNNGLSDSGTSMATPMVAGLAALIHSQHTGWTPEEVKADIMNTAGQDVFTGDGHTGTKYAPNRVGAGRIDAQAASENEVLAYVADDPGAVSASFGPLAVTAPTTLHKTIDVVNKGTASRTYSVSYDALTTVPGATYSVSPSSVTVGVGETKTLTLTLTINPSLLTKTIDPTVERDQAGFPREYVADASGRLVFTAQDSNVDLRLPVYSAPRPASVMTQPTSIDMPTGAIQTASLPLSGTGVAQGTGPEAIQSLVAGFELQATSPALPNCGGAVTTGCIHASDEKAADLKYVGTTSDAPELASVGDNDALDDGLVYFAISTQGPWHTAATQNEYDIWIDTNGDGQPDVVTFNTRLDGTDIFVAVTLDANTFDVLDIELINDRFGDTDTALYDSDTLVMPVWIGALQPGISGTGTGQNSRITYGIVSFGSFSGDPVDSVGFNSALTAFDGTLSTDVLNPGLAVYAAWNGNGSPLLYADMPSTSLTIRRDASSYAADHGMGALLVHFHNAAGNKAQVVDIDHHTLSVTKDGTGTGLVTTTGIDCGPTCSASYAIGSSPILTATPDATSSFTGWSGGGCSGTGTCEVTIDADTTVTATFTDRPPKVTSVKVRVNHQKRSATVKFRGSDPGHSSKGLRFKCKLDKGPFKSCKSPKLYKHLHKGKHTVQVKAIDKAGNVSKPVKKKFRV